MGMGNILITESQLKKIITEQPGRWLSRLIGNSADDLVKMYGDNSVSKIEGVLYKGLSNKANFIARAGETFLVSKSGTQVPMKTIEFALEKISKGQMSADDVINLLPRQLADGSEFRSIFQQSLESKVGQKTANVVSKLRPIQQKFLLNQCKNNKWCDTQSILSDFYRKLAPTAKMTKFYPSDVKVLTRDVIYPGTQYAREVLEVQVKNGPQFLIYRSSGSNTATTGKKAGEWFVLPGWAEDGWFFKTMDTIKLTKGGNKYLTDLAEFLEINGSNMLGK